MLAHLPSTHKRFGFGWEVTTKSDQGNAIVASSLVAGFSWRGDREREKQV